MFLCCQSQFVSISGSGELALSRRCGHDHDHDRGLDGHGLSDRALDGETYLVMVKEGLGTFVAKGMLENQFTQQVGL